MQGVVGYGDGRDTLTSGALERANIKALWARHDASQAHTDLAPRAARPFNGKEGGFKTGIRFRHAIHPCETERMTDLSVADNCPEKSGDKIS
jgi:hypothetical protein